VSNRTIYIIDDDDAVRDSLCDLLNVRFSQPIACFASGRAFLDRADDLDPGVLLLDYHMPDVSGLEVLRAVERDKFMTIMLTGNGSIELAMSVMRAGAADFLEKPYEPTTLLTAVEASLEKLGKARAALSREQAAQARVERLSERERAVLDGLIKGYSNKIIAHQLEISPRTVEIHRARMMDKLEVRSLSEALRVSFAAGMIPLD